MGEVSAGGCKSEMPSGAVVPVTDASSGFGKLTGSLLAERSYMVFGTSRKGAGGGEGRFEMFQLDITSDQSVQECVSSIFKRAGRIDVLVNNAGRVLTAGRLGGS